MYRGRVLVIGDEYLSLIGVAGGADSVVYSGGCSNLVEKLRGSIANYVVLITYRHVLDECPELRNLVDEAKTLVVELEKPEEASRINVKQYYAEIARKYLGIEIPI
ncbi:hypothetical protein [Desulfurococcus mucosus]|uniref:Uncharacterized protein n=1 Tax=Desulfurococcus mucosus (strain ATCC 35584 / DSM 2162 / JCM 9187 / O7/1) TaxID=765177 RepID=E8RAJ1_DESM0|nr:hypothetical protein [Desulfurococcus mucosus]ADV64401.1 hypothetical protein Desmu_0082 [Desulfurococcus mucosus DSM 2162]